MNKDLTNFWNAWRKTCAIRTCCSKESMDLYNRKCKTGDDQIAESEMAGIAEDARWVIAVTNGYFAKMIRTPRSVKALKKFADRMGVARGGVSGELEDGNAEALGDVELPDSAERPVMDDRRGGAIRHIPGGPTLADVSENEDNAAPEVTGMNGGNVANCGKMISEYRDLVVGWDNHEFDVTSAFELVEIDLYRDAAVQENLRDPSVTQDAKLSGRKLKDYLFEDIGGRPGGVCQNLWGYLLKENPSPWGVSRLRMVANKSFRNPVTPDGEVDNVRDEPHVQDEQAAEAFRDYIVKKWMAEFDVTDRVAICCAFLEYVMSDPFVTGLVPVNRSAFNARKTKRVSEIFLFLKEEGYDFDIVRNLLCGHGQEILFDIVVRNRKLRDPVCLELVKHFEIHRKRWAKEIKALAGNE